jgi:hypothetical protein
VGGIVNSSGLFSATYIKSGGKELGKYNPFIFKRFIYKLPNKIDMEKIQMLVFGFYRTN